jgi:hypothetical protein
MSPGGLRFQSHAELRAYLRDLVNFTGDPVPYDFNTVVHLMLALLDNLRDHALEAELEAIGESMTLEQATFFRKLATYLAAPESGQLGGRE